MFSDDVDPLAIGRQLHHKSRDGMARAMASREQLSESSFIDVQYQDLVSDPMKEIRRIYDFLDYPLCDESIEAMNLFHRQNPKDKRGAHRYRPEDFGLECSEEPELPLFGPPDEAYGPADNPALVQSAGEITRALLQGEVGPARNSALLSAALLLKACGRALTLAEGVDAASESLDSGAAREVVERVRGLIG